MSSMRAGAGDIRLESISSAFSLREETVSGEDAPLGLQGRALRSDGSSPWNGEASARKRVRGRAPVFDNLRRVEKFYGLSTLFFRIFVEGGTSYYR